MNWQTIQAHLPMIKETSEISITTPNDTSTLCHDLKNLAQEAFQIITLNSKNRMIGRHLITLGIMDASLIHPREVFRAAILDGAKAIVLVHNHPSGDPSPSAEDIRITRQLVQAGKIIDIGVVDHVIIGENHSSMRESGIVDFT